MLYLDTSTLTRLYVTETESEGVRSLVAEHENRLFTSVVTYAEVLSVLARCLREKRLSTRRYQAHKRSLKADWNGLHIVDLATQVLAPAERLIERHALRGFDAIQLCSTLWTGRPLFSSFDQRLREAAEAEGLTVIP